MVKIVIPVFISLFLLAGCTDNSVNEELADLRKENVFLKKKLNSYENAIVITRDNINKYVGALAYGPVEAKTNEAISVECCLYLHDLPLKVECMMDQENQSVKELSQISRRIENTFPGSGERILSGLYTVTFPNQEEWIIPWEKQVLIK